MSILTTIRNVLFLISFVFFYYTGKSLFYRLNTINSAPKLEAHVVELNEKGPVLKFIYQGKEYQFQSSVSVSNNEKRDLNIGDNTFIYFNQVKVEDSLIDIPIRMWATPSILLFLSLIFLSGALIFYKINKKINLALDKAKPENGFENLKNISQDEVKKALMRDQLPFHALNTPSNSSKTFLLATLTLILMAVAAHPVWDYYKLRWIGVPVSAQVTGLKRLPGSRGSFDTYFPIYKFTINSQSYQVESKWGSSSISERIGDKVELFVNPKNPQEVSGEFQFMFTLIGSIVALAFFYATTITLKRTRQVKELMAGRNVYRIKAKVIQIHRASQGIFCIEVSGVHPKRSQEQTFYSEGVSKKPTISVGEEVDVVVDPNDPEKYLVEILPNKKVA